MACVRSSTRTVGVPSTQSRQVRHKPPRRFLALQRSQHHRFLPTTQVIARLFIMVTHMTTDVRGSITYNGFATGFGPTPPYAAPGTWVPPPASYFSARGPSTFAAMGPPPQMGSYTPAEAGPSHVATPGMSSVIALSRSNIDSIPLFNID